MPNQFGPFGGAQIDFSGLADLPESFERGAAFSRQRLLRDAMSKVDPNDFQSQAKILMQLDPALGTRFAQAMAEQQTAQAYKEGMLGVARDKANEESPDIKLWREWNAANGAAAEPMRASPPQPSGVPGVSFQNAPAFITEKLAPVGEKKRLEEVGKGQGERDAQRATMSEIAPGFQKIIDTLVVNAQEADDETFKHALGPLQGAGEAESLVGAATQFIPQTWGALENYYTQGKKAGFIGGEGKNLHIKEPGELPGGYTTTLRSKINATAASLISVLQRAMRVPGIGAQSDKELQQIVNQVGELNKSRDKADFYDRLSNVVSNLTNLGIPIEMPTVEELAGVKPTSAVVQSYTQPPQRKEAGAVPYDAAEESPPAAVQGSVTTSDPRSGYAKSVTKLDGPAIARIRNWAAEAIRAGVPREVVMQRLQELGYGQ